MTYGYIRVSTDKQTVENQRFEINNFCNKNNIQIDKWIEETISGTKEPGKRALGKLLKNLKKDDILICSELSRLGRSLFMIMDVLSFCMKKKIQLWTIKDNYRLGSDISSKVLAFAFGLSAEIERNLISQRTKEALARAKAEGIAIGRQKGTRNKKLNATCVAKHKYIVNQLKKGNSIPSIAKKIKVARGTLYRYLAYTEIRTPVRSSNGRWQRGIY
ncbi:MAG: master DNA invertase Mpi family serine-type recombinase [Proteiniphilum sp.]|nr:master DNA invertase Mpi family serine-type recombinase [Proteiniphilum sp.]MDD3910150.1 master DNA invertase Mpi family serine-type recombinase [Proteiniphilum sp.]